MKILNLALALFALPVAAVAQLPATPPPVEMGLWKMSNTTTFTNLNLPPDVAAHLKAMGRDPGAPMSIHLLTCLTPEKWREMFTQTGKQQNCTYSNVHESSSSMSADVTCSVPGGQNGTGHMEMTFDSRKHMHGSFHMEVPRPQQPDPLKMETHLESEYQGADCQGVSPDTPKAVQ